MRYSLHTSGVAKSKLGVNAVKKLLSKMKKVALFYIHQFDARCEHSWLSVVNFFADNGLRR
jgi:hypothetical protein